MSVDKKLTFTTGTPSNAQQPVSAASPEPEVILGKSDGGATSAGWHSIESFLRCPKEYQFKMVRGIHTPLVQTPDHFAVGSLYHAGRARWFALRFASDEAAWQKIKDAVQEESAVQKLPVSLDAERRALGLLQEYVDHYSRLPLPKPVAAEYFVGPAPMVKGDPFMLHRTARLDDVSFYPEAGGKLCVGESKTTSTDLNDTINQYTLHGQPILQLVLWKMSPNGEAKYGPAAGIMLDIVKKPYGRDRCKFVREFVPVTDYTLQWYVRNMQRHLRAAAQIDWNADATRNIGSCTRMVGRARIACEFRDLCRFGKDGTSQYVMGDGQSLRSHKPEEGKEKYPWE